MAKSGKSGVTGGGGFGIMKKMLWLILMSFGGLVLAGADVRAQDLADTLARISRDRQILVGHRESSVPFSYYDKTHDKVVGYSQDFSNLIVAAIKKELKQPDLAVKLVPLTSRNRIPLLLSGAYDFECGSTTHTMARQGQVDFSNTIFIVSTRLLTGKDSGIIDFDDLRGRTVVVTSGTTSEKMIDAMNAAGSLNLEIISADDHEEAFQMVESGRAEAFFNDDALLAGERSKARNPRDWAIVGAPQSHEAYGCMLRKGDGKLKKLMDEVIEHAQNSGAALKSYNRWFMHPIPPNNVSLEFEMSDATKQLFASPNDRPFH